MDGEKIRSRFMGIWAVQDTELWRGWWMTERAIVIRHSVVTTDDINIVSTVSSHQSRILDLNN